MMPAGSSDRDTSARSQAQGSGLPRPGRQPRNGKWRSPCIKFSRGKRCSSEFARKLEDALKLLDRASLAWNDGKHEEAIRDLEDAVRIEEACLGPESVAVAIALVQLGAYLFLAGKLPEAENVLLRGVGSLAGFPSREKESVAGKAILIELYLKAGRPAEAEAAASDALDQCARAFGSHSVETIRLLVSAGKAAEAMGKFAEATARFEEALAICDAGSDGLPLEEVLPVVLGALVRVGFASGANEKAMRYLDRLLLVLPDDDPGPEGEDWPDEDGDLEWAAVQDEPERMATRPDQGGDA